MGRYLRTILLLCTICCLLNSIVTFSSDTDKHNHQMEYVLFGDENYSKQLPENSKAKDKIISLQAATYLCIDQFNYNRQPDSDDEKLRILKRRRIPGLPENVKDGINFNDSSHHRFYTHRGWNHKYTVPELEKSHWIQRKDLLISTVRKEMDPGPVNSFLSFLGNENARSITNNFESKCEALAELIYYIHLLGDHNYDYENEKKKAALETTTYKIEDIIIYIGGADKTEETIVNDLNACLKTLFSDQPAELGRLKTEINEIDMDIYKIRKSDGGINTVGKYLEYAATAEKLLEILHKFIPGLLRQEAFFYEAFYQ